MPLTVTPNNTLALMLVEIDYTAEPGTSTSATLYRGLSATGPWEELREVDLLAEQAFAYDNTMPFNTTVYYRTVSDNGVELISTGAIITTGTDGAAWIRDPLRPWADIEMLFCESPEAPCNAPDRMSWVGFGTTGRATDAGLFDILNAEKPADVYARRKNLSTDINFFTNTLFMKDRVYDLFTVGGPVYLTLPPVYGWADAFIQTTADLSEDYVAERDQRKPWRRWNAPVRTVDRPLGPVQGSACANWCEVDAAYGTFADMTAAGGTWGEVADGTFLCPAPALSGYGEGGYGEGPYGG